MLQYWNRFIASATLVCAVAIAAVLLSGSKIPEAYQPELLFLMYAISVGIPAGSTLISGLKSGSFSAPNHVYQRANEPLNYWYVAFFLALGTAPVLIFGVFAALQFL